ncbi:MAG: phosphatase PAP2 family protein [Planctomycetes bacterium]|nr:phosphatase PAP2 family protein [Planctomycetota bacterium]
MPVFRADPWLKALIVLLAVIALLFAFDAQLLRVLALPPDGLPHLLVEKLSSRVLGGVAFGVAFLAMWWTSRRREARLLASSVALTLALSFALKTIVGRPRPELAAAAGRDDAGFPSNHAAGAVAIALVASQVWPRWTPSFLAAATLYAATRLCLGLHYPSDVLGGALVATACTCALLALSGRAAPNKPA